MSSTKPKLSLRPEPQLSDDEKAALLRQAMADRLCVRWIYNRTRMQVAPQLLYLRNGSLHCDALVLEREGAACPEQKLGSFKLAGLKGVGLTSEAFTPSGDIDDQDPRYAAGIIARA